MRFWDASSLFSHSQECLICALIWLPTYLHTWRPPVSRLWVSDCLRDNELMDDMSQELHMSPDAFLSADRVIQESVWHTTAVFSWADVMLLHGFFLRVSSHRVGIFPVNRFSVCIQFPQRVSLTAQENNFKKRKAALAPLVLCECTLRMNFLIWVQLAQTFSI